MSSPHVMKTIFTRQMYLTFLPSLSILAAIAAAHAIYQVSIYHLTRDIAAIARIHPLSGLLSNLGILLWCAAASICLFSALTLRNVKPGKEYHFLLFSGLLSLYLLFDDLFMFHEELAPSYFGLEEKAVYVALGIAVSTLLLMFRRVILKTDYLLFLVALGFLATSALLDFIPERWTRELGEWMCFMEDGAKWLGIASWCSYYVSTSHQFLVSILGLPSHGMAAGRPYRKPLTAEVLTTGTGGADAFESAADLTPDYR